MAKISEKEFEDLSVPELETISFDLLRFCASEGALEHPDLSTWIEGGLEVCQRMREIALEKSSSKVLQLAQTHVAEWQSVRLWFLKEKADSNAGSLDPFTKRRKSGIVLP